MLVQTFSYYVGGRYYTEYHWYEAVAHPVEVLPGPHPIGSECEMSFTIRKHWSFTDPRKTQELRSCTEQTNKRWKKKPLNLKKLYVELPQRPEITYLKDKKKSKLNELLIKSLKTINESSESTKLLIARRMAMKDLLLSNYPDVSCETL